MSNLRAIATEILTADVENRLEEDFSLSDLSLDEELVIDPFSKKEYSIVRSLEMKNADDNYICHLFGVGPEKTFEFTTAPLKYTLYDSTNGSKSAGDIVRVVGGDEK